MVTLPMEPTQIKFVHQSDDEEFFEKQDSLKSPRFNLVDCEDKSLAYKVEGYYTDYAADLCTPALYRCDSCDSSNIESQSCSQLLLEIVILQVGKYMPLIQVQSKMLSLNKATRRFLQKQNYRFYTMFLRTFNLPTSLKKSEFLQQQPNTQVSKMKFIQDSVLAFNELQIQRVKASKKFEDLKALKAKGLDIPDSGKLQNIGTELKPFTFYSDGGILYDDQYYSMLNIFSGQQIIPGNQIGYQSSLTENVTICSYLGRKIQEDAYKLLPHQMKVKDEKNNPHLRYIQIDKYLADPKEHETYKIISQLDYYQQYPTYEYRCQSFFMFTAEKEVTARKSPYLKFFQKDEIPTLKAFRDLGFPLKQVLKVSGLDQAAFKNPTISKFTWSSFENVPEMQQTVGTSSTCYEALDKIIQANDGGCICEIDVSRLEEIEKILQKKVKASEKPDQYKDLISGDLGVIFKKKRLDFVPFLYVWNVVGEKQPVRHWSIKFEQSICAKYLITKIIDKQTPLPTEENEADQYLEPSILFGQMKLYGSQLKVDF